MISFTVFVLSLVIGINGVAFNRLLQPGCAAILCPQCTRCVDRENSGARCKPIRNCCVDNNDCRGKKICQNAQCIKPECTNDVDCDGGFLCDNGICVKTEPCIVTREYNPYCCGTTQFNNPSEGKCVDIDVTDPKSGCAKGECCGGILGTTCPDGRGLICVDNPNDSCDPNAGGADCTGSCQACSFTEEYNPYCCETGKEYVNPGEALCDGIDVTDKVIFCAPGTCCGGIKGGSCPDGFECNDIPGDQCDPNNGGADCFGSCQKEQPCMVTFEYNPYCCGTITYSNPSSAACDDIDVLDKTFQCVSGECCGGKQGIQCPNPRNQICVDNPLDSCDPVNGGADCMGSCQAKPCIATKEYNPYCCGTTTYSNPSMALCAGVDVNDKALQCQQGACTP